ncbi:MAG: trimethylamine methyltransferase family protein, partial [Gemmatimonadota bacterium]|nr:trimethylamine methyltransferase family protein [Gemmatimonadota bacterium]
MPVGSVLNDSGIERINSASLRILERVGLKIEHEAVRKRLLECGARISGRDNETVCFPPGMVSDYLERAPGTVRFCGL